MLFKKKIKFKETLVSRLKEVLTEGKWIIGSNIKEQIIDLNYEEATHKIGALNSIADLTFHLSYFISGVSNVLKGGTLDIRDKYSFDYPPIATEEEWQALIEKFCNDSEEFVALVEKFDENNLAKPFVNKQYGNFLRNINGIMEHSYYHFGQIVILKKLIRNPKT